MHSRALARHRMIHRLRAAIHIDQSSNNYSPKCYHIEKNVEVHFSPIYVLQDFSCPLQSEAFVVLTASIPSSRRCNHSAIYPLPAHPGSLVAWPVGLRSSTACRTQEVLAPAIDLIRRQPSHMHHVWPLVGQVGLLSPPLPPR